MFYPSHIVLQISLVPCWYKVNEDIIPGLFMLRAQGSSLRSRSHHIIPSWLRLNPDICPCLASDDAPSMPAQPWWSCLSALSPLRTHKRSSAEPQSDVGPIPQCNPSLSCPSCWRRSCWGGRWPSRCSLRTQSYLITNPTSSLVFHKAISMFNRSMLRAWSSWVRAKPRSLGLLEMHVLTHCNLQKQ